MGVTQTAGRRMVALYKYEDGKETLLESAPVTDKRVELIMELRGGRSAYSYRSGGQVKALTKDVDVTFLSTQKAKGFVGVIIGPYVQAAE